MKTTVKKISLYCCALIILTGVAISCQKETVKSGTLDNKTLGLQKKDGEITTDSLASLVNRMASKASDEEILLAVSAFKSLSATDLVRYYEIRKEIEVKKAAAYVRPGVNTITLQQEAAAAADLRIEVNLAAIKKYNRGLNVLEPKAFDDIAPAIYAQSKYAILRHQGANVKPNPTGKGIGIASCTIGYYGNINVNTGCCSGKDWYDWYSMSNGGSDCDYEFRYDGWYSTVRGVSPDTQALLVAYPPAGFGGTVLRRALYYSDGTDTGILLGALRVNIWVGGPWNVAMRAI